MVFSDIFSSTFLISLAITLFVASMLYIYISNKFAEQNHKINSMFSLISTMAEEQQYFRAKIAGKEIQLQKGVIEQDYCEENNDLISVSDNQDDEDSEYSSESDSEYDDDDEYNVDEEQANNSNNIDILNLGLINHENLGLNDEDIMNNNDNNIVEDNLQHLEINMEHHSDNDNDSASTINLNTIKTIHLEIENPVSHELDLSSELNVDDHDNNTINTLDTHSKHEYKKLSLNKLREVAVEKGIIQDASKLKKNEILKLLGDE
jgi:hypothetical protein